MDVTKTLTAVHQTGDDGNFAAGKQPNHDINKQIAGGCVSQLGVNKFRAPGRSEIGRNQPKLSDIHINKLNPDQ